MAHLPDEALQQVALYFQALAEPTRLKLLNALRDGERTVGDLAGSCNCSLANISKHLGVLARHGLVSKRQQGTSVYYQIADPSIYALCDLVCGNLLRQLDRQHAFADTLRLSAS